jgi:hypothetical protein
MKFISIFQLCSMIFFLSACDLGSTKLAPETHKADNDKEPSIISWSTAHWDENIFSARTNLSAEKVGSKIVLWGGYNGGGLNYSVYTDGVIFDPGLNTWNKINNIGAPNGRQFQYSAVSNDKVILFGGNVGLNDFGKIYNVTTDSWSNISTVGLPQGCYGYPAAYLNYTSKGISDGKLLVWSVNMTNSSDCSESAQRAFFGIYDLNSNSWSEGSYTGAPAITDRMSGTMTDHGFILWGGSSGSIYNLSNNTWKPIADATEILGTVHNPMFASSGDQLVVWSGERTGGVTSDGAVYNLKTKTWKKMNSSGAPPARTVVEVSGALSTAKILKDRYFVVWGGAGEINATGGVYDLQNDQWMGIPAENAHQGTVGFAAVEHNGGLLFFGGLFGDDFAVSSAFSFFEIND